MTTPLPIHARLKHEQTIRARIHINHPIWRKKWILVLENTEYVRIDPYSTWEEKDFWCIYDEDNELMLAGTDEEGFEAKL